MIEKCVRVRSRCWHTPWVDAEVDHAQEEIARLRERVRSLQAELAQIRGASQSAVAGANQPRLQTPSSNSAFQSSEPVGLLRAFEADQLLALAENLTGVAMWRLDRSTGVAQCSDQLRELFGLESGAPFSMQDVLECFHPEDLAKVRFDGRGHRVNDVMEPGELRIIRPDGSVRYILSSLVPLQGENDGEVWVGIVVDVTDRYALEAELKNAQKMEALGRLAGGVAHDFNNYLTVALGNAEMLRAGLQNESNRALLDEIISASERCRALTRRLLEFGRKRLVKAPVINVMDVLLQSQAILRRMLPQTMSLELCAPSEPLRVRVDASKLDQAIMNLVLNARDATREDDTILVQVHCAERAPRPSFGKTSVEKDTSCGDWLCIAVQDHGMGMDEETRARVFEPFFTTKAPGRGTGLGLSIVYGVVAQAGGTLSVHSTPGEGSRFEIWLPLVQ